MKKLCAIFISMILITMIVGCISQTEGGEASDVENVNIESESEVGDAVNNMGEKISDINSVLEKTDGKIV